ncbi:hypothetical protein [Chryseobacterium sp. W4I1]|uniref:hypothetical protein n=1 Tax=Chryseobacterium sp. W4I1 TaxID=3042293 RepID=UPI00278998A4|nr:hypothetical protein [Chryseobacterium sp. W4I1]MDQ0781353.1 hypothetical protein [Chryseobacterium sp. W4I1]
MNFEEALIKKQDIVNGSTNGPREIYIISDIPEEGDMFLQLILRHKVKYTDDLCKEYSSNGKYQVWVNPFS